MAVAPDENRLAQLFAAKGIARTFLAERPMRRGTLDGIAGLFITVRLTSYRSLPLSCIEGVELSIDGTQVASDALRLVVADVPYALDELGELPERWWFILDFGELFVPMADLPAGRHQVRATLITVEPYMTAGRFSMFNPDARELVLAEA